MSGHVRQHEGREICNFGAPSPLDFFEFSPCVLCNLARMTLPQKGGGKKVTRNVKKKRQNGYQKVTETEKSDLPLFASPLFEAI